MKKSKVVIVALFAAVFCFVAVNYVFVSKAAAVKETVIQPEQPPVLDVDVSKGEYVSVSENWDNMIVTETSDIVGEPEIYYCSASIHKKGDENNKYLVFVKQDHEKKEFLCNIFIGAVATSFQLTIYVTPIPNTNRGIVDHIVYRHHK